MLNHKKIALAGTLALATQGAAAFSPYYGQPMYAYAPLAAPGYAYPQAPVVDYRRMAYSAPQPSYYAPPLRYMPAPATREPTPTPGKASRKPAIAKHTPPAADPDHTANSKNSTTAQPSSHQVKFFERLQPLIEKENEHLLDLRDEVSDLVGRLENGAQLSKAQQTRLKSLCSTYRVDGDPLDNTEVRRQLLDKVDVVPVSLALAQAANESAWGKSRFAKEANNLFGIWTYDESQGIVPRKREAGKKHLVRKFASVGESVRYYMLTLNSHPAYAELRAIRAEMRDKGQAPDGHTLADGLTRYSAKGDEYVRTIQAMIQRFNLAGFDGTEQPKA